MTRVQAPDSARRAKAEAPHLPPAEEKAPPSSRIPRLHRRTGHRVTPRGSGRAWGDAYRAQRAGGSACPRRRRHAGGQPRTRVGTPCAAGSKGRRGKEQGAPTLLPGTGGPRLRTAPEAERTGGAGTERQRPERLTAQPERPESVGSHTRPSLTLAHSHSRGSHLPGS